MKLIELRVNEIGYQLWVWPHETLLTVLREKLGLTGAKEGCGVGECGACTVLIDNEPVNSCLMLAVEANGKAITTIEGLAQGESLHPVQEAFIEQGAVQCGFCTPGMVLTAKSLLDHYPEPTEEQIRKYMSGNLCRCTGYTKIVKGVAAAAQKLRGGK